MDLFFDKDVLDLLSEVKNNNDTTKFFTNNFKIITDEKSNYSFLLDKKENSITNYYTSHLTSFEDIEILNRIKSDFGKNRRIKFNVCAINKEIEHTLINKYDYTKRSYLIINLKESLMAQFHKGHRYNIKKALTHKLNHKIFFGEPVPESIMNEFYNSIIYSRSNIGGRRKKPYFKHSTKSFKLRKKLIIQSKAVLIRVEYKEKISYIFSLLSKDNGRYYDSGYINRIFPFTAHYAHYKIFETIGKYNNYYSTGEISSVDAERLNEIKGTLYYKKGFSVNPIRIYQIN